MSDIEVIPAQWQNPEQRQQLEAIRRRVFIEQQGVPEALEWDGLDEQASHFLARVGGEAVGCARLLANGQVGRMAVLQPWRQQGVGRALMQAIIDQAGRMGIKRLFLHAQTQATGFYQGFGFVPHGETFLDAGIPHRSMYLGL